MPANLQEEGLFLVLVSKENNTYFCEGLKFFLKALLFFKTNLYFYIH